MLGYHIHTPQTIHWNAWQVKNETGAISSIRMIISFTFEITLKTNCRSVNPINCVLNSMTKTMVASSKYLLMLNFHSSLVFVYWWLILAVVLHITVWLTLIFNEQMLKLIEWNEVLTFFYLLLGCPTTKFGLRLILIWHEGHWDRSHVRYYLLKWNLFCQSKNWNYKSLFLSRF